MNFLGKATERVIGRVGFRGNPQARREPQGQQGEGVDDPIDTYSYNSGLSAPGTTNLLAAGTGANQRGGRENQGQNQLGRDSPQWGSGNIPDEINRNEDTGIHSNVTGMGGGGNQGTVQDEGQPHNEQRQEAHQGPGGGQLQRDLRRSPIAMMTRSSAASSSGKAGSRETKPRATRFATRQSTKQLSGHSRS